MWLDSCRKGIPLPQGPQGQALPWRILYCEGSVLPGPAGGWQAGGRDRGTEEADGLLGGVSCFLDLLASSSVTGWATQL